VICFLIGRLRRTNPNKFRAGRIRRARFITPMSAAHWALAVQEHEAILNALQRRDGSGLAHVLRTHLRRKREEVVLAGFAERDDDGELAADRLSG
jgi:DNA-binding GntR family transcriptional regulator